MIGLCPQKNRKEKSGFKAAKKIQPYLTPYQAP
jgi:hypothetical protein